MRFGYGPEQLSAWDYLAASAPGTSITPSSTDQIGVLLPSYSQLVCVVAPPNTLKVRLIGTVTPHQFLRRS